MRHYYTIVISKDGYNWYIIGKYKFIDQRREAMEELKHSGKWAGYIMKESFE